MTPISAELLDIELAGRGVQDVRFVRALHLQGHQEAAAHLDEQGPLLVLRLEGFHQPTIVRVDFQGNKNLEDAKLREKITITPGSIADTVLIQDNATKIGQFYEEEGYWLTNAVPVVKKISENEVSLTYQIDEGQKVKIKHIVTEGNKNLSSKQIKKVMDTKEWWLFSFISSTGYYKKEQMETDIEKIRNLYYNNGFLKVVIAEPEITVDNEKKNMTIKVKVSEGDQFKIASVDFSGNTVFDNETIRKTITLAPNSLFHTPATLKDPPRINYPLVISAMLFLFFYVGAEIAFAGWIYTYALTLNLADATMAAYLTSGFWLTFTIGRLISIPLATRFKPQQLIAAALSGCLIVLGAALILPRSSTLVWILAAALGICMAPIWPSGFTLAGQSVRLTARVSGIILLGDKDQLAAVVSGAVFSELAADPTLSKACVERLSAATGIPAGRIEPAAPVKPTALHDSVVWLAENFRFAGLRYRPEAAGITLLQIDEPIFSTGMADLAVGKRAIELITTALRIPTCMHVCGNLGNVLDQILKFNVNVLDFEFANNPANLDLLSRRDLSGRMIGYGCVDSSIDRVESIAEIKKRIEKGVEIFGPRTMLIDPDCGMRMRSRETAYWKLRNMCDAAKEVRIAL